MKKTNPLLLAVLFTLPASAATTITLYSDDFSGTSANNLNATMTDVGAGVWTANTDIKADGSTATATSNRSAFLPFTPVSGKIYTATVGVNFSAVGSNTGSLQFGFSNNFTTTTSITGQSGSNVSAHAFIRQNGSGQVRISYNNPFGSDFATGTYNKTLPDIDVITLVLDTTAAAWTYQVSINGSTVKPLYTYMNNPTITQIGFGANAATGASGRFSNFSLTETTGPGAILRFSRRDRNPCLSPPQALRHPTAAIGMAPCFLLG